MLKDIKIKKSLMAGFIGLVVVSSILVIISLAMQKAQQSRYELMLDEDVTVNQDILYCRLNTQMASRLIRDIIMDPDNAGNTSIVAQVNTAIDSLEGHIKSMYDNYPSQITDQSKLKAYEAIITEWEKNTDVIEEYYTNYLSTGQVTYLKQAETNLQQIDSALQDKVTVAAEELDTFLIEEMDKERDAINGQIAIVSVILLAALIAVIIVALWIAAQIINSITIPTEQVRRGIVALSQGDFDMPIEYESKNELGEMCNALRTSQKILKTVIADECHLLEEMGHGNFDVRSEHPDMYVGALDGILHSMRNIKYRLSNTMIQITRASEQVDAGSDQVASSSQALSQGASEQASSTEELEATVSEISDYIAKTGEFAKEASNNASEAGRQTTLCNEQMKEMLDAMDDINRSSDEIGKIIKTIEDIAFQTNILALNAAVEAARAGSAGKGFAVVADEVRNLAAKSAEASKNTSTLIENSISSIGRGVKLANVTAEQLKSVVSLTQEVAEMVDKISDAAVEQTTAIHQVSVGIEQISAVVQTNSATAEEAAAASEELASQASILREQVAQFKVGDISSAAQDGVTSFEY